MLPGDQIGAVTGLVPALLSQCTEFAFLFRHPEGHLHARPARLQAALPRCRSPAAMPRQDMLDELLQRGDFIY